MRSREQLSQILHTIADNVYFKKPPQMKYPCIKYDISNYDIDYADDTIYKNMTHYTVTYIGTNPDNEDIKEKFRAIPYCKFNRRYYNDNLCHDVFDLFF